MRAAIFAASLLASFGVMAQEQTTSCDILEQYCPIAAELGMSDAPCYLFDDSGQHVAALAQYEMFCTGSQAPEKIVVTEAYMIPILLLLVDADQLDIK